jgi:hypothetical protein
LIDNLSLTQFRVNDYIVTMTTWTPALEGRPGPRYLAIADTLSADIAAARLKPGDRLPTHRDLAWRLGVAMGLTAGIVQVASSLADRGRRVILAGIDSDFRGEPFGPMPQLMAVAELVDKLHAICVLCGSPASRNQRLIGGKPAPFDSPTIMVGAADAYEARCRACHVVPRATEGQQQLL